MKENVLLKYLRLGDLMKKRILISGYGNVGKEIVRLIQKNNEYYKKMYDLELLVCGILGSKVCIFQDFGLNLNALLEFGKGSDAIIKYSKIYRDTFYNYPVFEGDIFIDCSKSNIVAEGPSFEYIKSAMDRGMDIVLISKEALTKNFSYIKELAQNKNIRLKYSGATCAALPTIDTAYYSLAGTNITSIYGILNGTTNYILTKMSKEDCSFEEALQEAKNQGIAESDASLDIKGIDSASKILIISNSVLGTNFNLKDVKIQGIQNINKSDIERAKKDKKEIKLISEVCYENGNYNIEVSPKLIEKNSELNLVKGTNKGIVFCTEEMGKLFVFGGASNPRGAATAAIKDVINISRGN
ncbi:homoserine dehydrogenase [Clostridium cochlearium]|uniref:homoserine dehydrogenase n=1 Tax=Clostridium cochlearium TaxID=1494 RepID=UPI00214A44B8|nr:homoserine dehydrogenase [Clostridium cochlearium]MCR1971318.1 homoserine dehydrogenase [Clostridium cochlearium]